MPRPVTLLSALILAGAGVAVVDAQSPYALPETPVGADAFTLPRTTKCIPSPFVVVLKVAAPSGAAFKDFEVSVDGRLSTMVSGATTASRHQIYVGRGTSEIEIASTTPGGQSTSVSRTYRSCKPKPRPKRRSTGRPSPVGNPISEGGGED